MSAPEQKEEEFSLKQYFVPLTTTKAIHFIIIIGLIVYFNSLFNGFVWDDFPFIIQNSEIHSINIFQAFGNNYFNNSGYYRPIPAIYFSIMYAWFGQNAFFYHLIQLLLHILCTCLLFLMFKRFLNIAISLFLALLFLIHPINVESVSYIAASQSELLFFPGILAFLIGMKKDLNKKSLFLVTALLLLSLLTKEAGIFFILSLILYKLLFDNKKLVNFLLIGLAVISIYSFIRFVIGGVYFEKIGFAPIAQLSLLERLENIPLLSLYYIKTLFFPFKLAIDQQWVATQLSIKTFYLPVIIDIIFSAIIAGIGFYIYLYRKTFLKSFLFFSFWFLSSFILLLQIFPLDMTVADRWFYFPLAGFLGVIGVGLQQIKFQRAKIIGPLLAVIIVVLFSIRTVVRNTNWRDLMTLYSHDVIIEDNFDNEHNYAVVLVQNGIIKESLPHFLKANTMNTTEFTLRDTGLAYLALNDKKKAFEYLSKALTIKSHVLPPHSHQTATYEAFARYYIIYGNYKDAKSIIEKGIKDYPNAYTLWHLKAVSEYFLFNKEGALEAAKKSYEIYPSIESLSIYENLVKNRPLNIKISNK